MAIIKKSKIKDMPQKEREEKLGELRLELAKERGFSQIGTVKNPGRVGEIRRTIARLLTAENQRKKQASKKP